MRPHECAANAGLGAISQVGLGERRARQPSYLRNPPRLPDINHVRRYPQMGKLYQGQRR